MLANIISADLPLAAAELLARAAAHEAGHAVAAVHFELPLKEVLIRDDGTGHTSYLTWLGRAEAECWAISNYAGPAAERDLFWDRRGGDTRDLLAIDNMIRRLGLGWDQWRLATLRFDAQLLVARLRPRIRAVAVALVQHRHLTAAGVRVCARSPKPTPKSPGPSCGSALGPHPRGGSALMRPC
jgi:hypothetical protein